MEFSVGDKVVHPQYGAGSVASVECQESEGGSTSYYVVDIPDHGMIVHVPVLKAEELGLRPAMTLSAIRQVLSTLRSEPECLPDDPREREAQIGAKLSTGQALPLARVVRDLTWHKQHARLTRREVDLLTLGQTRLAGEMALASGDKASDSIKLIGSTMTAALAAISG